MNTDLLKLEPQSVWRNFRNILNVPHPSGKEEKIRQFVKEFGDKLGLQTVIDEVGNIVIKKPATRGMENRKKVILQSHLDMVPQKNDGSVHNFETDPIQSYIDNGWVKAKETTLGADNGIGIAVILGVLESTPETLSHPAIEAFFTVEEEIGMNGAFGLKSDLLKGDVLFNLDSEDEGELFIGCGSGIIANMIIKCPEVNVPGEFTAHKISVKGLRGGHSGLDIHLGRANSNKLLFRFLKRACGPGYLISSVEGGNMPSAIPRETSAVISIPPALSDNLYESFAKFSELVKKEYCYTDPDMFLTLEPVKLPDTAIDSDIGYRLVNAIVACPSGVMRYSDSMPGLVETSASLSIIKSNKGTIEIKCLLRSSVESAKTALCDMVSALFELVGAEIKFSGGWPGWEPNINSPILKVLKDVYKMKFGRYPGINASHAGVECGLIGNVYPDLDMISFGPTIRYPHSPDEKVNIITVGHFWEFLVEALKNIPVK